MKKNNKGYGQQQSKKQPGGAPASIVIQQLNIMPVDRRAKEMPDWKAAIQGFESIHPTYSRISDLTEDIELDPHVEAVTGKIKDAVTSARWEFVDRSGQPVEAINELIDTIGFDELLEGIVDGKLRHYSMMEPEFYQNQDGSWEMSCTHVPLAHIRPLSGIIALDKNGDDGLEVRKGTYARRILEVGTPGRLGLHMKAAPYVLIKKGDVGDWAMFVQTFGEPIIDAVWDGLEDAQRTALITAIKSRGPGGALVRPAGTDVQLLAPSGTANGDLQEKLMTACNREISKAYIGSTETTESSSSSGYAQSKTHEGQDERKHARYITFARKILNTRFTRILQAAGFDTAGGKFVVAGEDNELSKKEMFDVHLKMGLPAAKGGLEMPIDHKWMYETYGMQMPEDYDQQMAERAELKKQNQLQHDQDITQAKKTPKAKPKGEPATNKDDEVELAEQRAWWMKLFDRLPFFPAAPAQIGAVETSCCGTPRIQLSEADAGRMAATDALVIQRVWDAAGSLTFDPLLHFSTADVLLNAFKMGWDADVRVELMDAGFTYGVNDPALITAFEQNIFRFSAAKTLAQVQELNALFRQAGSFRDFERLARQTLVKYNRSWLESEYNTALLTGEAAATYQRLIAKSGLFTHWEYRTVGDEHVRKEHRALHGLILPWDDPRWNKLFPPNGWNCRCFILPRMAGELSAYDLQAMQARADAYFGTIEYKRNAAQGWGVNRGAVAEIFTANQQYVTKQPGMAAKMLNALGRADYQLPSYSQMKKGATSSLPVEPISPADFYHGLEVQQGQSLLRDYHQRPVSLEAARYQQQVDQADKARLLAAMRQTMSSPDEVWIHGAPGTQQLSQMVYIRYYQDHAMVVVGDLSKNQIALSQWFTLPEVKSTIQQYRRGILIKSRD